MVDAAVVMIENAHKKIEHWEQDHPSQQLDNDQRWTIVTDAAAEVGPALFFSLLIITLSFVPIFTLQGQEGRLFAPLAFTQTYAMAAAARSEAHTSELPSLMRISYAVVCLKNKDDEARIYQ